MNKPTILAKDITLPLDTWKTHLNNNVMIVGASGRGKSRGIIAPNIMQMNSNYVISDPKGVLVEQLGTLLEGNGYIVKVLDLVDFTKSNCTYNPLRYVHGELEMETVVDYLISNVRPNGSGNADPFWDESARNLIVSILCYLFYERMPEERTLTNAARLLQTHKVSDDYQHRSELDILFEILEEKSPNHPAVRGYKTFRCSAERTQASILISALTYLRWFLLKDYELLTSTDTLALERLSIEKTALFIKTSDVDRSKNWLVGLLYCQLFDILCNQNNPRHVRFLLDDFCCCGRIPDFDYKLAMIRSRNISAFVVIQDEAQLEKEYGMAAKGIISNCDSYIFLGASNIESCEMTARRLGDRRVTGQMIRQMPYNKCVVISGNTGGIYEKFDLKGHGRYEEIADADDSPNKYQIRCIDVPRGCNQEEVKTESLSREVVRKDRVFDSDEEEYLYTVLSQMGPVVDIHCHLRDCFVSTKEEFSRKIFNMHCDFVLRDNDLKPLFGIEVDGSQHQREEKQIANDTLKDFFFTATSIPLLRIQARDIRNNVSKVIETIKEFAKIHGFALKYPENIVSYSAWKKRSNSIGMLADCEIEEDVNLQLTELGTILDKLLAKMEGSQ